MNFNEGFKIEKSVYRATINGEISVITDKGSLIRLKRGANDFIESQSIV